MAELFTIGKLYPSYIPAVQQMKYKMADEL